ncbi:MAG: glycosyltransferase family 2 protein [Weeksellaceae bacterium]|nr:glycosyltransferase family 2 protein [Weeksellaceae bacterium]
MKTGIIILNWNGKKLLGEFLPSVVEHSKEAKIFVIDNASTDDSIDFLIKQFPQIKIIQNPENQGFAKGYNRGIQSILKEFQLDVLCLLNSDVKVSENWLPPILELFKTNQEIAVVQPKILDYKNPNYFEYAGAGGGFLDNLGYPFCRGRIFWTLEEDKGQYDDILPVFWASGACFFIRVEDFIVQNGFDESYFAHMEEIDLCWRLNNSKRKIYYCGKSTVYHLGGGTLKSNNPQKTYLNFRNSLGTLAKNLPAYWGFPLIFTRLSLDGITGIVFLFYESWAHCWAIVRSHFDFYKRLPVYLKNRKAGKPDYFHKKWVPFQYFLFKRKYYKELK